MARQLLILVSAALAGCAVVGGETIGHRIVWRCDGAKSFSVNFTTNAAELYAGGRSYTLPHAPSGSGARYAMGGVVYWEHAGEAQLSGAAGGPYAHCKRA